MKNQLKGISLILFGILLVLVALVDPWIPIIEDISNITLVFGLFSGIVGMIFSFRKEK